MYIVSVRKYCSIASSSSVVLVCRYSGQNAGQQLVIIIIIIIIIIISGL